MCAQGVLHNTLAHSQCIHNGSQSVLYNPTVVHVYGSKGAPLYTGMLITKTAKAERMQRFGSN